MKFPLFEQNGLFRYISTECWSQCAILNINGASEHFFCFFFIDYGLTSKSWLHIMAQPVVISSSSSFLTGGEVFPVSWRVADEDVEDADPPTRCVQVLTPFPSFMNQLNQ